VDCAKVLLFCTQKNIEQNMDNRFSEWLNYTLLDNSVAHWLWFIGILLSGVLLKKGLSLTVSRTVYRVIKSEAGNIPLAEFVRLTRRPFELLIILLAIYSAFDRLTVPVEWDLHPATEPGLLRTIERVFLTLMAGAMGWLGIRVIKFVALVAKQQALETHSPIDDQLVPFLKDTAILFWVLTCFFLMLNKVFEVNVWALITSLGIGGLVVALAARETIENLIASVAIMVERPFSVGDAITLGTVSGDVEQVGFRSTRLRADDGSLVSIPNRLLTSQTLENTTQRTHRRAKFYLRLPYNTSTTNLESLLLNLKTTLSQSPVSPDKETTVRLDNFGESGLEVLVIYHVKTASWKEFMQVREEINFKFIQAAQQSNVTLIPSTSEIHLSKS
jgi:MscS family membrane protein